MGYRIVDKIAKVSHVILSKRRNKPAATKLLVRPMEARGLPRKIFFNESAANTKGISDIKRILKHFGFSLPIEMVRISFNVTATEIRAALVRQLSLRPHSEDCLTSAPFGCNGRAFHCRPGSNPDDRRGEALLKQSMMQALSDAGQQPDPHSPPAGDTRAASHLGG